MRTAIKILAFGISVLVAENALAKFTYEGHLTDISDNTLSNQSATVRIAVVPPASTCVLFMETHSVLTDDKGFFSVQVGAGTDVDSLASTIDGVFLNQAGHSGMSSCTYSPAAGDGRRLRVEVDIGSGYDSLGFVAIGKSPQAAHADYVAGYTASNFVRTSGTAPSLSSSDVSTLVQLIAGTSSLYAAPGASGTVTNVTVTSPLTVASGSTTPAITIAQSSASAAGYLTSADWTTFNSKLGFSSVASGDLSGTLSSTNVVKIRGVPVNATAPSTGNVLTYNGSNWIGQMPTAAPVTSVAGKTGVVTLVSSDISGLGNSASQNIGTAAGTVAAGDDSRIVNALSTALTNGETFFGNGGNVANARNIYLGDIRSSVTPANPAFNISGGCSPGTMLSYFSPTDDFTCQPFGLTTSQVMSIVESGQILMPVGSNTSPSYSFSGDPTTGIYSSVAGEIGFGNGGIERMRLNAAGKLGIGTSAPDSRLAVVGTMRATSISGSHFDNSSAGTLDLAGGNLFTSSFTCASAMTLNNLRDGGSYKIVMKDAGTNQCTFGPTVGGMDAGTVVYKFSPVNAARTASSETVYELSRFGNTVYVKWAMYVP